MTEQLTYKPIEICDLAEGMHESDESVEPISPLKTTTVPAVQSGKDLNAPAAETGMISQVSVEAEGKDNDDSQDASLTRDETKPEVSTQKSPDVELPHSPTVLIIEDTTELAEVIQATLERMNIVTAHETHGTKALAKFEEMSPDVVLLDISLPDMTGWKILDTIKDRQETEGAEKMPVVIVITAYGDPANRLVGKLQGVHSYLVKPFTADEVENVVRRALSSTA